jgi:hypothetical protein
MNASLESVKLANDEKLLSLFEPDIHLIVRGKAGGEVEFANLLILGEQSDGLIIDWELFKEEVPADTRLTSVPFLPSRSKCCINEAYRLAPRRAIGP